MDPSARAAPAIAVIGGGPGGLMAAEVLATAGATVTVFDRMPTVGRKFLLAGRGGLNLTHSEPFDSFADRYGPARPRLEAALAAFGPQAVRDWCDGLGQPTFVGTSGRVFPAGLRATPLLRAWLARLSALGVDVRPHHTWRGWNADGTLAFTDRAGAHVSVSADATVLALGGASWPRTGSDGSWTDLLADSGIATAPLRSANSGYVVRWSETFRERFAGVPLKNVRLSLGTASVRGEAMITATGIEGGAVYALSRHLREAIERDGQVTVTIDLRPDLDLATLQARLARRQDKDSASTALRRAAGFTPIAIGLLREASANVLPRDPADLAILAKALPITLVATQPLDRAISTAGGVLLDEVDDDFMVRRRPGTFVVGEMLDWEAPTGGYLLQATFATAVAAAHGALAWVSPPASLS